MKATIFFVFLLIHHIALAQTFAWAKQFSGPNDSHGNDVVVDASGNVYTTGYLNGTVDFDPGPGVFNLTQTSGAGAYVSKLDANGNFAWAKQFESWNIVSYAIALDASGNIYTTGFFQQIADFDPGPGVYNLTNVLGADVFISKLDNNGNFIWAKQFGGINNIYLGCYDLTIDGAGNVITTGHFKGMADFDPGPGTYNLTGAGLEDIFIAKLDANGNFVWAKQMTGNSFELGQTVAVDATGNIYTAGYFSSTVDFDPGPASFNMTATNNSDIYISKLDPNGNFVFSKQLSGSSQALPASIALNPSGDIFLTGHFRNTIDADPGPAVFNLVSSAASIDLFLLKLDINGNFAWAKQIGSSGQDRGHELAIDVTGNIFVTGDFENTVDMDPGGGVLNFVSAGGSDMFFLKIDNAGNLSWAKQIGGPGLDLSFSVKIDIPGNLYSTGLFEQTVDFNPEAAVYNLVSAGVEDAYVLKLGHCAGITFSTLNAFSCFPYTLNGQTYNTSGTYTQTLINAAGCDSILTLNLSIGGSITNLSATACDSYVWEGQTYTTSGNYSALYTGADGCDSIRMLTLTIKYSVATTMNISICEGQVYAGYSISGTYTDIYVAANGCDSTHTLNLDVKPRSFSTISAAICEGQSYAGHSTSGTYTDTYLAANGCDSIRTLNLVVNPKKFTTINAAICQGQSYFAGGANQTISGIYKDTLLTNFGCDSIITTNLTVNPKPTPDLGIDKELCAGTSVTFNPGLFNSYSWQDLSTLPDFTANAVGVYWVTVTNSFNCTASDTIKITAINPLPGNFLKPSDSICSYEQLVLFPLNSYAEYHWSTGSVQSTITVSTPGQYWLTVTDANSCVGSDTTMVFPKQCITGIFFPTAFTPNGDGKNDFFKAIIYGNLLSFRLQVYDRAGQLVFQTTNPLQAWNGIYGNLPSSSAVYVWQSSYQFEGEKPGFQKGTVTVIK